MQPFPGWNGSHRVDPRSRIIHSGVHVYRLGRVAVEFGDQHRALGQIKRGWEAPKGLGGKYSPFLAMSVRVLAAPSPGSRWVG